MEGSFEKYYRKDYRKLMMLIALMQFIGLILIPIAIIIAFLNWKIALILGIVGISMFRKFGDLNITQTQKWIKFADEGKIKSKILYCESEPPETAEKFRFVTDNVGGLFRDGNDIVFGTLRGELRCNIDDFQYQVIKKNSVVNYLIIKIGQYKLAIFPKWDGALNEHPTSADKADWAAKVLDELITIA